MLDEGTNELIERVVFSIRNPQSRIERLDTGSWINNEYIPLKIEYRESSIQHLPISRNSTCFPQFL